MKRATIIGWAASCITGASLSALGISVTNGLPSLLVVAAFSALVFVIVQMIAEALS